MLIRDVDQSAKACVLAQHVKKYRNLSCYHGLGVSKNILLWLGGGGSGGKARGVGV